MGEWSYWMSATDVIERGDAVIADANPCSFARLVVRGMARSHATVPDRNPARKERRTAGTSTNRIIGSNVRLGTEMPVGCSPKQ